MGLGLAAGVYGVMIDDDAVFLDVATNAYFCLPGISSVLGITGRSLRVANDGLAEDLVSAGLAREGEPDREWPMAIAPRRSARAAVTELAQEGRRRPNLAQGRALLLAGLAANRDHRRPFARRLPPISVDRAPMADPALLADLEVFRRLSPWVPFDGVCLYRSGLLRHYLTRLGHRVDWVFGVRTWPFSAHCWLQAGDMALDDEAERLVAYHPILVV